jgi:hypothetical protein
VTKRLHVRQVPLASQATTDRRRAAAAWSAAPDFGQSEETRLARARAKARADGVRVRNVYRPRLDPSEVVCGTAAMFHRGCRCDDCRDAARLARAEQRRQKKAAEAARGT